jgi:uncharacterized Zn finger protein
LDIGVRCPECRSEEFLRSANPRRDEVVTCVGCGRYFTYGELEDQAVEAARKIISETFPGLA